MGQSLAALGGLDSPGDSVSTPIFINNFNNLNRGFVRLVKWLTDAGYPPCILDNDSTYHPLLEFYRATNVHVVHIGKNLGPYAFWELGLHKEQKDRFIVTDPDVAPAAGCQLNLIAHMHAMMDRGYKKVGPSLRIDNLPSGKKKIIDWESQFWTKPVDGGFEADIDTTFAMYEPGSWYRPEGKYLRLAPPYSFDHIPWYETEENDESLYYRAHARKEWTNW